jgi:hypothetical protein
MRNLILKNFWWKLLSLILGTLVWLVVNSSLEKSEYAQTPVVTVSTRSFPTVPITLMTSVNNTNQFRLNPDVVSVEVSGKPEELEKLFTEQIKAFVDVTKTPDEKEVRLDIEVQVPRGFKIESFKPAVTVVERATPSN